MEKFIVILCLSSLPFIYMADKVELEKLANTFTVAEGIEDMKCNNISTNNLRISGCYECYLCSEEKIKQKIREKTPLQIFTLYGGNSSNCEKQEVCCISQGYFKYRSGDSCGIGYPQGYPRVVRNTLREVLPGEFPWRAWIYHVSNDTKPLCAATFVHDELNALLAPASCVDDWNEEDVRVSFTRGGDRFSVNEIIRHDDFNKVGLINDIAIVLLNIVEQKPLPKYVKSLCQPASPQLYATSCITVSEDDNLITTVIPQQSQCDATDKIPPAYHMCSITLRDDYSPEYGAGLFCLNEEVSPPRYFMYGISVHSSSETVKVYTNVTHYISWLADNNIKSV